MNGPVLVVATLGLTLSVAYFCEGEDMLLQKTLFAFFTLGGYMAFGFYVYTHPGEPVTCPWASSLGLFCIVVLWWATHLDAKGRSQ